MARRNPPCHRRSAGGSKAAAKKTRAKSIGVAEWQTRLVHSLPEPLRSNLPTIEQIEEELAAPSDRTKRRTP